MNKLVRYSIVCVDRENETVLQGLQEEVVNERMDEGGFTAWKILEFVQSMDRKEVRVPAAWRERRPEGIRVHEDAPHYLKSIGRDTRMFLRVPFNVVERWPRERFKYEEKQIEVLEQIRHKIGHLEPRHGHRSAADEDVLDEIRQRVSCDVPPGQKVVVEIEPKS
jgi:hypothetical protein